MLAHVSIRTYNSSSQTCILEKNKYNTTQIQPQINTNKETAKEKKRNSPIPMLRHTLSPLPIRAVPKPLLKISASAKHASMPRHNNALDTVIDIEHGISGFEFGAHGIGKGIVVLGAEEREDDDGGVGGVVLGADLRKERAGVVVGGREGDVWGVAGRLFARGHDG